MQNKIMQKTRLLNAAGDIDNPGYATKSYFEYSKQAIKARKTRIKEWDYYYVGNEHYGIALTIADNHYMGLISASLLNFDEKTQITRSLMIWLPMGKLNLPENSDEGVVSFKNKKVEMTFSTKNKFRKIACLFKNFERNEDLVIEIELEETYKDKMVIATPFAKRKHFYLNEKINGLSPNGFARLGSKTYLFDSNSYGLLDWGRGVWTYKNTWYWSSASGMVDNIPFGFNLGYGFGDLRNVTENMLFYNGIAHKLDDIVFEIPKKGKKDDFMKPWKIHDQAKRVELTFTPVLNRHAKTDVLIIGSTQDQVFGYFNGFVGLADGKKLVVQDLFGFAEKVKNKW
ncbi:MAG: DUF2804 domain-containing protein [Acholeplasmataceae bacterium]